VIVPYPASLQLLGHDFLGGGTLFKEFVGRSPGHVALLPHISLLEFDRSPR
jgi:hypothetical protein